MVMEHPIIKYQEMTEEQILGVCHDLLRYCNHTVRATSESVRASLAKCDTMDKIAELYKTFRQTNQ